MFENARQSVKEQWEVGCLSYEQAKRKLDKLLALELHSGLVVSVEQSIENILYAAP